MFDVVELLCVDVGLSYGLMLGRIVSRITRKFTLPASGAGWAVGLMRRKMSNIMQWSLVKTQKNGILSFHHCKVVLVAQEPHFPGSSIWCGGYHDGSRGSLIGRTKFLA